MSGDVTPTRRQLWDDRHAAREPIESHEPDPSLAAVAGGLVPGRAIDLAAGDGRNAIWLAAHGWQVTAVDFSAVALDRARTAADAAGVAVAWGNADLLEWRPEARSFELVALMFLHLPAHERRAVYAGAAEAVGPGGRLLVVGHDLSNLADGAGGPRDPDVLFTPEGIAGDLEGLVVARAGVVRRDIGEGRTALDAVVVAARPPEGPRRQRRVLPPPRMPPCVPTRVVRPYLRTCAIT